MKKIFIGFLAFITFIIQINIVLADGCNVVVENARANAGETVEIKITLENNTGLIAALLDAEYDRERLELVEVTDCRLLAGGTFSPNYKSYPYKMVWNSASHTNFTDSGTLAVLKFKVLDNAKSGNAFINLSYNDNDVFDVDLNNVSLTVKNGGIEVAKASASLNYGGAGTTNKLTEKKESNVKNQIVLTIGKKDADVFGEKKSNDVAPIIRNDRTMLPARFVAENLGADVKWDEVNKKVIITRDDIEIVITIDSQTALVNGSAIVLESPAFIENDRTYTPLRFIAEKLGASVSWNGDTKEVTIIK